MSRLPGKPALAACIMVALVCALPLAHAMAADPDWHSLAAFVGTYPRASPQAGKPALMQSPAVRSGLAKLLTPAQQAQLASYAVSPPVQGIDHDLLVQFCKPHDCGNNNAMIVIDPAGRAMWVAFYTTNGGIFRTDWVGTDDPAKVPASVFAAISKIHSPF